MAKIILHCGDHKIAQHWIKAPYMVLTQGVETGHEMMAKAINLAKSLKDLDINLFSNNDHILNGLRLALKAGDIEPDQLQVLFHRPEAEPRWVLFDKNGTGDYWPQGFFDAWDDALSSLLDKNKAYPLGIPLV